MIKMTSFWSKPLGPFLVIAAFIGCSSCANKSVNTEHIKDVDGNTYRTVKIGEQEWMAENLRATRLKDGTPIKMVENYDEWAGLSVPAYCWYNNDSVYRDTYGALYNSYVVETGKVCPEGWHVPTDADWRELETHYGGAAVSGGFLKSTGTELWKSPNTGAIDADGFSALPGGYRNYAGPFNMRRIAGFWWSSTEQSWFGAGPKLMYRNVNYDEEVMYSDIALKTNGLSIRCIKDRRNRSDQLTE